LIRVFPRKTKWTPTDPLAFVGDPSLFLPSEQPVKVSVTFEWDIPEGERLLRAWSGFYPDVELGGPAFGDPGGDFVPGRFIKAGVTITSRGCIRHCEHCFVPSREGKIRELEIKDGYIVQDNNLLACIREHVEAVFSMLRRQKQAAIFSGGLDTRLLQVWHRDLIDSIRVHELWFAADSVAMMPQLRRAAEILTGIPERKRRCYVMIGFKDETLRDAKKRLEEVYALEFLPFAQLYRGPDEREYTREWRLLAKKWSRPAAYKRKREAA
jgi:hypothetical protein